MAGSFDRLMLTVGLLDKITGPMRGIQRTIQQVTSNSRKAFMNTAAGVTALIAASASFANTVNPANDMNMALGEVRSMDVADDTLKRLNQAGLQYSIQFGESASNYVRSAYDIQSAIDGLEGADLPKFTTAAGTLAKATKANVTDITSYFGSMYGIFREQANGMGKGNWVEMLAGQTATAVQMFKTTGPEMKSAFESIGAGATEMGVKINEQMAVLGTLQSTMSGSEAGTKYGAFLEGLSGAQAEFGLNFSDANGDLLPIVEIMKKIKGEMGGMGWDQSRDFLSGAFNDEAIDFIQLMGKDINKLGSDINELGDITGMEKAEWMAAQMQNNFARLAQSVTAVSIAIWQKALPSIEPYINMMTDAASVIVEWADKYPHLTKAVGLLITGFIALVAVAGVVTLAIGLMQYAHVGLMMRFVLLRPIVWAARLVMLAWSAAMWVARTALLAFVLYGPAIAAFFTVMKTSILTTLPAIWSFTAALLANPITWVVVGVVALIAALVALVVYWDDVSAAVGRFFSSIGDFVDVSIFEPIQQWWGDFQVWLSGVSLMPSWDMGSDFTASLSAKWAAFAGWIGGLSLAPVWDLGSDLVEGLAQKWGDFQVWLSGVSLMPSWNLGIDAFDSIKQWWTDFKGWLSALDPFAFLGEKVDWLKNKLSWLPGIDTSTSTSSTQEVISKVESQAETVNKSVVLPGAESSQSGSESGGLFQTISNMFGGNKKSVHVEKMEVNNNGQAVRGADLLYQLEMEAG
ncbi:phage tail tape measure protein [Marinomonas sp. M1K-6]|uniref:Phage tail tape measure protein n=1 Tax=Marinomonas profundi TaxID=2726122 RepID=A0A847R4W6_9GAMM|nr:phage tail tape measure protein [Marinomonas profundi]NLQ17553.1 phage tail tape measure protein [Marinomonas profundi]UDV02230.1 phage tail tape measure protein [Marinomonas profundi]